MSLSPHPARRRSGAVVGIGALVVGLTGLALPATATANPAGTGPVITEAYTRGGSSGAAYQQKFVEITNPTGSALSLDGLSLQYVPAKGGTATGSCALSGSLAAGASTVIAVGSNGSAGAALTSDSSCASDNPAAAGGTLAIVSGTAKHAFTAGDTSGDSAVVDALGWGTAAVYEGSPATAVSTTALSYQRSGTADTDSNAADFTGAAPTPAASGATSPTASPTATATAAPAKALSIAQIQGTGDTTPYSGQTVTTRGVVTAVYTTGGFSGYYIQTPGTGGSNDLKSAGDASDGLFVYDSDGAASLSTGDCLDVTGTATEFYGLTQISKVTARTAVADCEPVTAVGISESNWPSTDAEKEAYEGMLVRPTGAWTVTDNYSTNQYGQVGLAVGDKPLYQATDQVAPGAEAIAYEAANAKKEIYLDDGSSWNYTSNKEAQSSPLPYLVSGHSLRAGAAVTFTKDVVLDYRHGWNLQPTAQVSGEKNSPITWPDTRPAAPKVGGDVSVTSFNVLNYFTDLGQDESGCKAYKDREGNAVTASNCTVRGAYTAKAFAEQQAKIVAAINELDSSVVGLEEIENSAKLGHDRDASLAHLVSALNEAAGFEKWAYVPSPSTRPALADEDVIRTALIYQKSLVAPVGDSVILDDAAFTGTARQPLAQRFRPVARGEQFVVIVNHFKSKGSVLSGAGNADSGDGQGANNAQRVLQAKALVKFAEQFSDYPTLMVGDYNSYSHEDPITTITSSGYTLIDSLVKNVGYSYQYSGRIGSLDHVLLNAKAAALVSGAKVWDVNADESIAYEYSRANYNVTQLWAADPYRSSDHDPVKVGLNVSHPVKPAAVAKASGRQKAVLGDWDGDGTATWALVDGAKATFYNENAADAPVWKTAVLGHAGAEALVGDWDGDGDDELALVQGKHAWYEDEAGSTALTKGTVVPSAHHEVVRSGREDKIVVG